MTGITRRAHVRELNIRTRQLYIRLEGVAKNVASGIDIICLRLGLGLGHHAARVRLGVHGYTTHINSVVSVSGALFICEDLSYLTIQYVEYIP